MHTLVSSVVVQWLFFSFSMKNELIRLVVLPCFDLCRSKSFHVHWEGFCKQNRLIMFMG